MDDLTDQSSLPRAAGAVPETGAQSVPVVADILGMNNRFRLFYSAQDSYIQGRSEENEENLRQSVP